MDGSGGDPQCAENCLGRPTASSTAMRSLSAPAMSLRSSLTGCSGSSSTPRCGIPSGRPSGRFPPAGMRWAAHGPKADCLAQIERRWTDMRPGRRRATRAADPDDPVSPRPPADRGARRRLADPPPHRQRAHDAGDGRRSNSDQGPGAPPASWKASPGPKTHLERIQRPGQPESQRLEIGLLSRPKLKERRIARGWTRSHGNILLGQHEIVTNSPAHSERTRAPRCPPRAACRSQRDDEGFQRRCVGWRARLADAAGGRAPQEIPPQAARRAGHIAE